MAQLFVKATDRLPRGQKAKYIVQLSCDVFEDPVVIRNCGHTFCKKCISKLSDNQCSICKVLVHSKDFYEDKQLNELLSLIQQLKSVMKTSENLEKISKPTTLDQAIVTTPSCSKVLKLSPGGTSLKKSIRSTRLLKPAKCLEPGCKCLDGSHSTALKPVENIIGTPKNTEMRKRKAFTSPVMKALKRSPFRSKSFTVRKRLDSTLRSPKFGLPFSPENLEKKNAKGETPLHVAVIKGDITRVRTLLNKGANPNVKDNAGWTPLHEASNFGYLEITKLLVTYGANLNVPGQDNITPLHDAVMNNRMDVANYLASKGADIYTKTSLGNTALDLCTNEEQKKSLIKLYDSSNVNNVKTLKKRLSAETNFKLIFLPTSLNDAQKEKLQNCAQLLKANIVQSFCPDVSHVITSCDANGLCTRTLKVMQGILAGKWIVNYHWIELCLEFKEKVSEEAFEVLGTKLHPDSNGPKRARENLLNQLPPLFDGCYFYLHGQFSSPSPQKEDICQLIQIGGGKILTREPKPETVDLDQHQIPYHASGGPIADISYFILYQDKPPRQSHIRANHICTVNVSWFIKCISAFTLLDPDMTIVSE